MAGNIAGALEGLARLAIPAGIIVAGLQYSMFNGRVQDELPRPFALPCIKLMIEYTNIVEGGHRAVLFDRVRGILPITVNEGTHFLIPWWQRAIIFDVRTKPRNIPTTTGSKDMQMVSLTLRVLHRPDYEKLPIIYQSLGEDYDERVLPSIGNEVLKAIVAQFDASELITQRELVCCVFWAGCVGRMAFLEIKIRHALLPPRR